MGVLRLYAWGISFEYNLWNENSTFLRNAGCSLSQGCILSLYALCVQHSQSKYFSDNYFTLHARYLGIDARVMCKARMITHRGLGSLILNGKKQPARTKMCVRKDQRTTHEIVGHARQPIQNQWAAARFGALWAKIAWTKGREEFCVQQGKVLMMLLFHDVQKLVDRKFRAWKLVIMHWT